MFPPSGTPFCMADVYNHKFGPSAKCYADVNAAPLYHPPFLAKFTITILLSGWKKDVIAECMCSDVQFSSNPTQNLIFFCF